MYYIVDDDRKFGRLHKVEYIPTRKILDMIKKYDIEPGDLLFIDIAPDDCGGTVVPRCTQTIDDVYRYLGQCTEDNYNLVSMVKGKDIYKAIRVIDKEFYDKCYSDGKSYFDSLGISKEEWYQDIEDEIEELEKNVKDY